MTSYFVLMDFLDSERSGMALATERRVKVMAEELDDVTVVTLDHQPDHPEVIAALRAKGRLHDEVRVTNFYQHWFEASGPAPAPATNPELLRDEPGYSHYPDQQRSTDSHRYYDADGRYAKYKLFVDGRLSFVDYQSANMQRTHRVKFDRLGYLIRETRFNPTTNKASFERYFDRTGTCYLSVWVNGAGQRTKSVLHPWQLAGETLADVYVAWVSHLLEGAGDDTVVMLDELNLLPIFRQLPATRRVITLHGTHLDQPFVKGSPVRKVYREIFTGAAAYDAVVFLTQQQKSDVEELFGTHANFHVIPHALSPAEETDPADAPPRQPHSAITLSRLEDSKNLGDAIRAFRIVVDELPDAAYHVFGYGSQKTELEALIDSLGLRDSITLHPFIDDVDGELRRHAASVMTSRYEGFCLAILESLGNGTPALSYRTKYGPEELIDHEVNGFLVESGNYRQLAAYLLRVFSDPELARRLGQQATQVRGTYSFGAFRSRWLTLFASLGDAAGVAVGAEEAQPDRSYADGTGR